MGRRNEKTFKFFSPAGEVLKTRKQMLECQEFEEASKEDQMLLTEFKPRKPISLVNGSEEDKKMTDLFKCGISSKPVMKRTHVAEGNIQQKNKMMRLDTKQKTSYPSKEVRFLRA